MKLKDTNKKKYSKAAKRPSSGRYPTTYHFGHVYFFLNRCLRQTLAVSQAAMRPSRQPSPLTALALQEADSISLDIPTVAESFYHKDKFNLELYRRAECCIGSDYRSVFLCHACRWLHVSTCKLNPSSTNNAI